MKCWWLFFHKWEKPRVCRDRKCCREWHYWHYPAVGVKETVCGKCGKVKTRYPW